MNIIYFEDSRVFGCSHSKTMLVRKIRSNSTCEFFEFCTCCLSRIREIFRDELLRLEVDIKRVPIMETDLAFKKNDIKATLNALFLLPQGYELKDTGKKKVCNWCQKEFRWFYNSFEWRMVEIESDDLHDVRKCEKEWLGVG